jgi:hypothetical protein
MTARPGHTATITLLPVFRRVDTEQSKTTVAARQAIPIDDIKST